MSKTLSWEVDASDAIKLIDKMIENAATYRQPLSEAGEFLRGAFLENFNSDGSQVGGWDALSPVTTAWRAKNGYGPTPKLVNDGDLLGAVAALKRDVGAKEGNYAVVHPLAPFHQYGSTKVNLPARKIVFEPKGFAELMARRVGAHIIPNRMTGELKRLFQR